MTYQEQIKHPKWQKKRLEILERDKFTCQGCGEKEKTLHVHHLGYIKGRSIWDYHNGDLVTYCAKCHDHWHELNEFILRFISQPNIKLVEIIKDLLLSVNELGSNNFPEIISIINLIKKINK